MCILLSAFYLYSLVLYYRGAVFSKGRVGADMLEETEVGQKGFSISQTNPGL